ncbi:MAG: ABC transporter ATP-binding protein [Pyrinomonadaceae bacterium]
MALAINKLSKRFGNTWALRDVSFEVADGSVIGLFGASGSGKSTLLNAIAGTVKATSGSILVGGRDVTKLKAKERGISLHIGHGDGGIKGILSDFFDRSASGESQLSRFEQSSATAGRIWLLDAPFSKMDPQQRDVAFAEIREAAKVGGRIVFFASSDFDQIIDLTDEVAVLDRGEIVQTGTPQEIYDDPRSVKLARATGQNNLIPARRLTSTNADLPEFYTIDGAHRVFAQSTEKGRLGAINQNVTLAIRPEQVVMSMGVSFPEDNLLKGVVTAIKFRGAISLIEFDIGGLTIETRVFKPVGINIGDECMLGLPPHRIQILKD